jgi:hypothetical protein
VRSPFSLSHSTQIHLRFAGIAYEKKAKRKDKDATDEHIRYTTLLSSFGSEMSSAKQSVSGAMSYQRKTDARFAVNMLYS